MGSLVGQSLARLSWFGRQVEVLVWVLIAPLLILILLATARGSSSAPASRVVIVDTVHATEMLDALEGVEGIEVLSAPDLAEAQETLVAGTGDVILNTENGIELVYDANRAEGTAARLRVEDALQRTAGREDPLPIGVEAFGAEGGGSIDWIAPGLVAFALLNLGLLGVGLSVVERRAARRDQDRSSSPTTSTAALLVAGWLGGTLVSALLLVVSTKILGAQLSLAVGSVLLASLAAAFAFSGLGIFLGSLVRARTAFVGIASVLAVVLSLVSGVFVSYELFSESVESAARMLPLIRVADVFRGVLLEGRRALDYSGDLVFLFAWGTITAAVGSWLARRA